MSDARAFDGPIPRSVAIIMDGNGRWARSRGLERIRGHERGVTAVRETVEECARLGVEAVTLYAFSAENWSRPQREISLLMRLLKRFLIEERSTLDSNEIRLVHSGRRARLPADVLQILDATVAGTATHRRMTLALAINYGGRQELADAARRIATSAAAGELDPETVDEACLAAHLYHPELPDPDLLIRTASELRVSNFLLWQISYAEIHVSAVCWPDFRTAHLHEAFRAFGERVRKFGAVVQ